MTTTNSKKIWFETFWRKIRSAAVITLFVLTLAVAIYGIVGALHSPLFIVRVVEVSDLPEHSPLDAQTIVALAAVPVGRVNLFDLDLKLIEQKVLDNSWIKEVRLNKRFPQTLSIFVKFREPKALIQLEQGQLAYVDTEGQVFGQVSLMAQPDLPILFGVSRDEVGKLIETLKIIRSWPKVSEHSQISSISWDAEQGYRVLATYPLKKGPALGRVTVHLGQELDADFTAQIGRLEHVLKYLTENSIPARQIWADASKKIVVKTAHGS